jgi:EAL domain-containing protein (putative c-di-GMP-specific phosphodiesterase class I)
MDAALDRIALPAGSLLFAEGEPGSAAYLVKSGLIEVFLVRDDCEVILASRGPGEIVGEMAILDSRPRSASARVVTDCELVLVSAEQIAHRIADTDPILRMCLGVVIGRYREMVAMIDSGDRREVDRDSGASAAEFEAALGTLSLESELRRALLNSEFELFFQPIVRLPTQRLAGFEALLRWRHPTRGLVAPGEFIPIAEASGLIVDITDWCLAEVGRTFPEIMAAALRNVGAVEPLFMSVNISGHDLARASFVESVAAMLARTGIEPGSIKLEVTETVLMKDPAKAVAALESCRRLGLTIAIDDFGTGYSSLSYLSTLPIATIKIDRSFVHSMIEKPASSKIIHMILRLAEELGIPVVAEGIEDAREAELLGDLGCALAQGYLFGRPAPLAQTLENTRLWRCLDERPLPQTAPAKMHANDRKFPRNRRTS